MKILEVVNLRKQFGETRAVNDVSLSVDEGSVTGLIGPNGSGKSTLFNVVSGSCKPDGGQVHFRSTRIDGLSPSEIFKMGLVKAFQIPNLFLNMTVLENTLVPPKNQLGEKVGIAPFRSRWRSQEIALAKKARNTIEFLQLGQVSRDLSKSLSGGQMKLCDMGRALMGDPTLMMLDEPTAGVAPNLAQAILEHMLELKKLHNLSFFVIEHRLELFLKYVDYVYVMNLGQIISEGKPHQIVSDPIVQEVYLGHG